MYEKKLTINNWLWGWLNNILYKQSFRKSGKYSRHLYKNINYFSKSMFNLPGKFWIQIYVYFLLLFLI